MFKYIVTPALIALTLAGAANAASPSSDAQLAAAAGVEADGPLQHHGGRGMGYGSEQGEGKQQNSKHHCAIIQEVPV